MKTFSYSIPSPSLWASFDHGTVEATSKARAHNLAVSKIDTAIRRINDALAYGDTTSNYRFDFDPSQIEIKEVKSIQSSIS